MALLDNRYVQLALVAFAVYVFVHMQKKSTEHLDAVVNVTGKSSAVQVTSATGLQVPVQTENKVIITPTPVPIESEAHGSVPLAEVHPLLAGTSSSQLSSAGIQKPTMTAPAATSAPSPLTAMSEQLYAVAPAGASGAPVVSEEGPFTAEAVDYDEIFNRNQDLEPSDLIPKTDGESALYGDLKPDPNMQGNLLVNAYQLGIETNSGKRNFINDPRPILNIPPALVSPWNNPTTFVDTSRKSFADL